jgi:sugar phosphate isomerase/epimerase
MNKLYFILCFLFLASHPLPAQNTKDPTLRRLQVGASIGIKQMTPELMRYARSVGIFCLNVSLNQFFDKEGHFNLKDEEITEIAQNAKKAADDAGLEISAFHMPYGEHIDLSSINEAERERVVALHEKVFTLCRILNPKIVLFHPSWYLSLNQREEHISQMIKSAVELQNTVKAAGAIMVIENMTGPQLHVIRGNVQYERPLCRSVEEMIQIMDRLPSDIYGAVDMNHILNPEKLVLALGSRLKFIHVSDGDGEHEFHYLPCLAKGMNDWNAILSALNDVGYTGPFMFECHYKDLKELPECYNELYNKWIAPAQKIDFFVKPLNVDSVLTVKNFPLLSLLQQKDLKHIISKDEAFQKMVRQQHKRANNALDTCQDPSCYVQSLQWISAETHAVGSELINIYRKSKALKAMVVRLKKEGSYNLYSTLADTAFLRHAWNDAARGINYILSVYVKGQKPTYTKIDAIRFGKGDTLFKKEVQDSIDSELQHKSERLFFNVSLEMAIDALKMNGRDECARYVPLNNGLNRLPYSAIKNVQWKDYKYSMILVPGLGPEIPGVSLDPGGAKRCEEAVERFHKGLAPFIVVSGGHVHPNKTPFCEAVEMKKYLVDKLNIPDSVVFIEPHARHTTTNIRNVSRMIFKFGIPSNMPVLIVTDSSQNNYIVKGMTKTALRDLDYLPYEKIKQLNDQEVEFYPAKNSLQVNPLDPLDP